MYVFLALIYGGSDILDADIDEDIPIDEYKKAAKLRKRILDVSQDITYGVSSGKNIPPKQYILGLATHQISGRSKKLVNVLSNAGQIIPYKKLLNPKSKGSIWKRQNRLPEGFCNSWSQCWISWRTARKLLAWVWHNVIELEKPIT